MPPLVGFEGRRAMVARLDCVGLVEIDCFGCDGRGLCAEMRVRWHSLRMEGIDDAGRSDAIENA